MECILFHLNHKNDAIECANSKYCNITKKPIFEDYSSTKTKTFTKELIKSNKKM